MGEAMMPGIPKLLSTDIQICSPTDLRMLIQNLKKLIALGKMRQIWPAEAPFATETKISDLNENGPWPDYLEWYFATEDNRRYQLSVDTYHGAG